MKTLNTLIASVLLTTSVTSFAAAPVATIEPIAEVSATETPTAEVPATEVDLTKAVEIKLPAKEETAAPKKGFVEGLDIAHFGDMDYADFSVVLGIGSRHISAEDHRILNETNPAIGFEIWDIQVVYVSANSWEDESFYVAYSPEVYTMNKYFSISANAGFATGYDRDAQIEHDGITYHAGKLGTSKSGIVPLVGISLNVSPFGGNFTAVTTITPMVIMQSFNYSF